MIEEGEESGKTPSPPIVDEEVEFRNTPPPQYLLDEEEEHIITPIPLILKKIILKTKMTDVED